MKEYLYYLSGMPLATFRVDADTITVQPYGAEDFTPLTTAANDAYTAAMHFDPRATIAQWQTVDFIIDTSTESTTTAWGAQYERASDFYWINRDARPALDIVTIGNKVLGFQMTTRNVTAVLVERGAEQWTTVADWEAADMLQAPLRRGHRETVMVPMRDGVRLATTIILPADAAGPFSVVMERTPYDKSIFYADFERFVQRGYAVVLQDVRGRTESEGEWVPMKHERDDGDDTINWLAAQDWSNGRVGMIGGSYGGFVQWAAASSGNPHLRALVSMVTAGGPFTDIMFRNGVPMEGFASWYFAVSEQGFTPERLVRDDWAELFKVRPLHKIPEVGLGHELPGYTEIMQHQHYDDYLEDIDWQTKADKITVPALIQSGWFDDDGIGTTEALKVTANYPAGTRKVILGPWLHGGNAQYDLGAIKLPANAIRHDIDLQHMRWFDHFLYGVENGVTAEAPVEYFTMNDNRWHTAADYEPTTPATTWYLDAATGTMGPDAVAAEAGAQYDYDPENPSPQLVDVSSNEFAFPNDYAAFQQRADVVSFTAPAQTTPLTITGWFDAHFYARSSAVDTDWGVRLTDVTPDGQAISIADGIMNAKIRNDWRETALLEPGQVYEYTLQTQKTSYCLQPGHKLRLDFFSAMANLVFPNSNTAAGYDSSVIEIAHQEIMTGGQYPTSISFHEDTRI